MLVSYEANRGGLGESGITIYDRVDCKSRGTQERLFVQRMGKTGLDSTGSRAPKLGLVDPLVGHTCDFSRGSW